MAFMAHNHVSATRLLGAFLLISMMLSVCLCATDADTTTASGPSSSSGGAPTKKDIKDLDYNAIKQDFMCRACVSLAGAVTDGVLPALQKRYKEVIEASAAIERDIDKNSPWRDRLVVEVHEAIDGLCDRLAQQHKKLIEKEPLTSGSKRKIYKGIDTICTDTLEEVNDQLAEMVLLALRPDRYAAFADSDARREEEYNLPAAGAFCEAQKMCSPFVHYDITSDYNDLTFPEDEARNAKPFSDEEPSILELMLDWSTWHRVRTEMPWDALLTQEFWAQLYKMLVKDEAVHRNLKFLFPFMMGLGVSLMIGAIAFAASCIWWMTIRNSENQKKKHLARESVKNKNGGEKASGGEELIHTGKKND